MTDLQYVMNALSKAQNPMMDGSHQPDYRECARAIRRAQKDRQEMEKEVERLRSELGERDQCNHLRVCQWREDEEGHWFGRCGIVWTFNDLPSTPHEHGMVWCPKCGGMVLQHTWEEPNEAE